jgi:hypothetical protein
VSHRATDQFGWRVAVPSPDTHCQDRLVKTLISSRLTGFHKRILPLLIFLFLGLMGVIMMLDTSPRRPPKALVLVPLFIGGLFFFLFRRLVWDLADEVYDCGDALLVRKDDEEVRIPLNNIMNVSVSTVMNPPRIGLKLIKPSRLGDQIDFTPISPFTLNPLARNPIGEDLMVRVHEAKGGRG